MKLAPSHAATGEIYITDLSHDGRGVGRLAGDKGVGKKDRGKTCFVSGALPSETVIWQQTDTKKSFNQGVCLEVLIPSEHRVEPNCPHFLQCGGCDLQHLSSNAQVSWKQQQLEKSLNWAGVQVQQWQQPLTAKPWGYRRKARLAVAYPKKEKTSLNNLILGYRKKSSSDLVNIQSCAVLEPRLEALIPLLRELALSLKPYQLTEFELSASNDEVAICASVKNSIDPKVLTSRFRGQPNVQFWQQLPRQPAQVLHAPSSKPYLLSKTTKNVQLSFKPNQFIQVNHSLNSYMLQNALDWIRPEKTQNLLDLFCGGGNFSMAFAPHCATVLGLEGLLELCDQAELNAQINGLTNCLFKQVALHKPEQINFLEGIKADIVLLDPARQGAAELMPWLLHKKPKKVLYVSCHPATMVRDLALLNNQYQVSKICVMDMFSHTAHIECMALLEPSPTSKKTKK